MVKLQQKASEHSTRTADLEILMPDGRRQFLRAAAGAGAALVGGAVLTACGGGGGDAVDERRQPLEVTSGCAPTVWDLTAGQTHRVGSVTVSNDADKLIIEFALNKDYEQACFGDLHVWVGNDLNMVPLPPGNCRPNPGQFCQEQYGGACADASGLRYYKFEMPWADLNIVDIKNLCAQGPVKLYVFTHAEVDLNCGDGNSEHETAWGGPTPGDCNAWFFYGQYTVCCETPPPPVELCETAFAKGGWILARYEGKANPEKLPALGLTLNRWGWAIKLTGPGMTTYDIYAGAGLNRTSPDKKVGTLTVVWNGALADVTYDITRTGCSMKEVHLYAGDGRPSTAAPGQYGHSDSFDPKRKTYTFEDIPLADTPSADGVWLIAHAVVCCACSTC